MSLSPSPEVHESHCLGQMWSWERRVGARTGEFQMESKELFSFQISKRKLQFYFCQVHRAKFYLAFENSVCDEYITEKVGFSLKVLWGKKRIKLYSTSSFTSHWPTTTLYPWCWAPRDKIMRK